MTFLQTMCEGVARAQTIRVLDKDDESQWKLVSQFGGSEAGHKSAIWQVEWAHPEFGQVLATCSDDRTVIIWREREVVTSGHAPAHLKLKFEMVATLQDFQKGVTSIGFAPAHLGLQIASACNDGKVRVHQGNSTNLTVWELASELEPDAGFGAYITCLSWNRNRVDVPMMAVGWWRQQSGGAEQRVSGVGVWGYSSDQKRWSLVTKLDVEADTRGLVAEVRDVDWAPCMGRPEHRIAAAVGAAVQVWSLRPLASWPAERCEQPARPTVLTMDGSVPLTFWKAGWNLTGTTLAASAENGQVRMWKLDFQGQLKPHCVLEQ